MKNVYDITLEFEKRLADYTGAPYVVTVDNQSNALFLALMYEKAAGTEITIPSRTYPSVPCEIIHAGAKVKFSKVSGKTQGKLIVKEYPTAGAHAGHFKALMEELKQKKKFVPDMVIIDYLNICSSSRMKQGANVNSYTYIKSIAEELRGLAVEYAVPILSATQTTRSGFSNTDVELTDTSESFGLPATVDFMFALISSEELEALNQLLVKQLKNRYGDPAYYKKFVIGVDRSKMKLYNLEAQAQQNISESGQDTGPVFDKSDFGKRIKSEEFEGFKF
jgi:hypothetical protein